MGEVKLRGYRDGDLETIYALDVVCFEPVFRFTRRAMRRFAEAAGAIVVIAEVAEGMVGFCIVQMEGDTGYVVTLDVEPTWRRAGVAGQMMDEAERRAAAAGGLQMELHVSVDNAGAIRFYEQRGYGRASKVLAFYGKGLAAWVHRKPLRIPPSVADTV